MRMALKRAMNCGVWGARDIETRDESRRMGCTRYRNAR